MQTVFDMRVLYSRLQKKKLKLPQSVKIFNITPNSAQFHHPQFCLHYIHNAFLSKHQRYVLTT